MRPDQPSPGSGGGGAHGLRAAPRAAASRSPTHVGQSRASSPRPRRPRPSGPRIQRRISAASAPDRHGGEGASAASNRWWPSSKTIRFRCAVSTSAFWPRAVRAPSKAAWVITRAWLAMTRSARREARIAFSMKQTR